MVDGQAVGFVGELHPKWRQGYELPSAPVLFELATAALLGARRAVVRADTSGSSLHGEIFR